MQETYFNCGSYLTSSNLFNPTQAICSLLRSSKLHLCDIKMQISHFQRVAMLTMRTKKFSEVVKKKLIL